MDTTLFGLIPIGGKFKEESYGVGLNRNVLSGMIFEKISKSKAKIIGVYGNYGTRHINGVQCFGYYKSVQTE